MKTKKLLEDLERVTIELRRMATASNTVNSLSVLAACEKLEYIKKGLEESLGVSPDLLVACRLVLKELIPDPEKPSQHRAYLALKLALEK